MCPEAEIARVTPGAIARVMPGSPGLRRPQKPNIEKDEDAFDRMLAAQSVIEDIPIVGRDRALLQFGVVPVW